MFLSVFFFRNSLQFKKVSLPLQPQTRNNGAIAQLVEQRTENPCVPGSIPGGTTFKRLIIKQLLIKVAAFFISFCIFFGGFSMIFQLSCKPRCKPKKEMAITVNVGKSSVSCPLKPSDSTPLKHSTMPP